MEDTGESTSEDEAAGSTTEAAHAFDHLLNLLAQEHRNEIWRATRELHEQNLELASELSLIRGGYSQEEQECLAPPAPRRRICLDPVHFTAEQEARSLPQTAITVSLPTDSSPSTSTFASPDGDLRVSWKSTPGEDDKKQDYSKVKSLPNLGQTLAAPFRSERRTLSSSSASGAASDVAGQLGARGDRQARISLCGVSVQGMKRPSTISPRSGSDDVQLIEEAEDNIDLEVLEVWQEKKIERKHNGRGGSFLGKPGGGMAMTGSRSFLDQKKRMNSMEGDALSDAGADSFIKDSRLYRGLSKCVADPSSSRRMLWDVAGLVLIFYDMVMIPLQLFHPPKNVFVECMNWGTTIYWTVDIPANFLVSYHKEGLVEKRLEKIALYYAKTWLPIDIGVIMLDWVITILDLVSEGSGEDTSSSGTQSLGFARIGKTVKFLRLIRLLRLFKAHGVVSDLLERIQSEYTLILTGVFKLLMVIVLLNHFIACAFYGIGDLYDVVDDIPSWVKQNKIGREEEEFGYRYLTALHWSITQFTPASMEVVPENTLERGFTVTVILFAMVTFSSFVSAITNAMTQLRNLNKERNDQFSTLRKYLSENQVSTAVMGKIWACLQQSMKRSKHRVHEFEVKVLDLLPWSLKTELQEEVYAPILTAHPFFWQYCSFFKMQMRKIYQNTLEEVSVGIGQELFNSGENATRMYFVISGILSYKEDQSSMGGLVSFISSAQWLCEPVLWVKWSHSGQLIATTHCELVALKAPKVQEVLSHVYDMCEHSKAYARNFVTFFKKNPDLLNDIWADADMIADMAHRAFYGEEEDEEQPLEGGEGARLSILPEDEHDELPRMDSQNPKGFFGQMAARRKSVASGLNGLSNLLGGAGVKGKTPIKEKKDKELRRKSTLEQNAKISESKGKRETGLGGMENLKAGEGNKELEAFLEGIKEKRRKSTVCACGNKFKTDSNFCRRCGIKRPGEDDSDAESSTSSSSDSGDSEKMEKSLSGGTAKTSETSSSSSNRSADEADGEENATKKQSGRSAKGSKVERTLSNGSKASGSNRWAVSRKGRGSKVGAEDSCNTQISIEHVDSAERGSSQFDRQTSGSQESVKSFQSGELPEFIGNKKSSTRSSARRSSNDSSPNDAKGNRSSMTKRKSDLNRSSTTGFAGNRGSLSRMGSSASLGGPPPHLRPRNNREEEGGAITQMFKKTFSRMSWSAEKD